MKYSNTLIVLVISFISSVFAEDNLVQYWINNPQEFVKTLFYGNVLKWFWNLILILIAAISAVALGMDVKETLIEIVEKMFGFQF